tara:strand:+ start:555 stop:770 length:216 start_codon:yes stop_codon:yes gene_type:complete
VNQPTTTEENKMKEIIENLRNPRFNAKGFYLLLLPLRLLPYSARRHLRAFAIKHWNKYPAFMHRLNWSCTD